MSQLKNVKVLSPTYKEIIPSTNKEVSIKPFKVGDEKILLMASESKDEQQMVDSLKQVVSNCMEGEEVENLSSYDMEYMFIKIRSKSVGEIAKIMMKCPHCETGNEVDVDLNETNVIGLDNRVKNVKINDELVFEMKEPKIDDVIGTTQSAEGIITFVAKNVGKVFYGEEVIEISSVEIPDVVNIINQLTSKQFEPLQNYITQMPKLSKDITYSCSHCGTETNETLEGLSSFF